MLSYTSDWNLPGFSSHSPCVWAHQLPFTKTMFFVPCGQELMQPLCIFITLFCLRRSFCIYSLCPPSLLPLFLFCSVALALYRSFLLSASKDVRHSSVWLCLPSPSASFLLPPFLLSPFTEEEEGFFSPSATLLFVGCVLYVTVAKISNNIKTQKIQKHLCGEIFVGGKMQASTRTTCHRDLNRGEVNDIFAQSKEAGWK